VPLEQATSKTAKYASIHLHTSQETQIDKQKNKKSGQLKIADRCVLVKRSAKKLMNPMNCELYMIYSGRPGNSFIIGIADLQSHIGYKIKSSIRQSYLQI